MCYNDVVVNVVLLVVGLLGLIGLGLSGLGILGQGLKSFLFAPVKDLDDYVADAADNQDVQHDVELHTGAQVGTVGVSDDETGRLPQTVVREGCLLVASE